MESNIANILSHSLIISVHSLIIICHFIYQSVHPLEDVSRLGVKAGGSEDSKVEAD